MDTSLRTIKAHECCYSQCREEGAIHIGANGSDSHWIRVRHFDYWNRASARLLADGGRCEMQELGELLEGEE